MLKLDRLVHRIMLALSLCLVTAALSPTQMASQAATQPLTSQPSIPAPLVSPASFAALDAQAKYLYLQGVIAHWQTSGDGQSFAFVQAAVDSVVTSAGDLRLPPTQALPFGQAVLLSYRVSRNPALYRPARQLRDLLQPQQDKADISVAPFLADFGVTFGDVTAAEQAADILLRVDTSGRDLDTGLLHGSGSPSDLPRNTLYALDLLGAIDRLPLGFHHRRGLAEALNKTVSALIARQGSYAVWQTPGQPTQTLLQMAEAVHSAAVNPADEGARMLAQSEADQAPTQAFGQGKTVIADSWFTAEPVKDANGKIEAPVAKWDVDTDQGLSFLGYTFERYGMQLDSLRAAPTTASLSSAQIYVIAAPAGAFSHQVTKQDADAIEAWVNDGGVLVLMGKKAGEEELPELNTLADRFGMHFSQMNGTKTQGTTGEQEEVATPPGNSVFPVPHRLFMPGTLALTLSPSAHPLVKKRATVLMAVAPVGRGTVLAIADPWLWNEYLDGRKIVPPSDNFAAAIDLTGWILKQTLQ